MRFFMISNSDNTIKLDQFLKLIGIAATGGQAKLIIQGGEVLVNGILETRRGRKLRSGDTVTVAEQTFDVNLDEI
ncbi:RNA-binding S4 domain-containing protein [Scytonema millei VB511283]|uniref:RNA-binding S4 domain-containing protein n=2 Tax=Scytonema TaxID=1203 RepID=A0A9X5I5C2_9CYAN|nr:RNA-binding S4 domain-containing protein [Scytonema millei VB511283]